MRLPNFHVWRTCLVLLLPVVFASCATGPKSPEVRPPEAPPAASTPAPAVPEVAGPPEPYGPLPIATPTPTAQAVYGPAPVQIRPIVLVLGPGMARGFAFAGALRALSENKIPIAAIYGTEMGGFIGALYGIDGNLNHFEWALTKFSAEAFRPAHKVLGFFDDSNGKAQFDLGLKRAFGKQDLSASKIPVRLAVENKSTGQPALIDQGEARLAVRAVMAAPDLFPNEEWKGTPIRSAVSSRPFMISEAKTLGMPIVVINVIPELGAKAALELGEAGLLIQPNMKGIGPADFSKRTEAVFRGKQAIRDRLREIRDRVGYVAPEPGSVIR